MSSNSNNRLPGYPRHYEVGYGKPPKRHRFKKGQSGNPRGRPKGAKRSTPALPEERLKDIVLEEANRTITFHDGDRTVTLSTAQVIIHRLAVDAAKGNPRAQQLFIKMVSTIEKEKHDEWLRTEQRPSEIRIFLVSPEARRPETVRDQDNPGVDEGASVNESDEGEHQSPSASSRAIRGRVE